MADHRIDTAREIQRGFEQIEFEQRTVRAQVAMRAAQLDVLLLTTEPEVRYFTGFHTQFFESPTRPWFVVVPATDRPIAVIPEIGATGMQSTWIEDIRTWPSPRPEDDGISLLADALNELPSRFGHLGIALGTQSVLRMPIADYESLAQRIAFTISDCALLLHHYGSSSHRPKLKKSLWRVRSRPTLL